MHRENPGASKMDFNRQKIVAQGISRGMEWNSSVKIWSFPGTEWILDEAWIPIWNPLPRNIPGNRCDAGIQPHCPRCDNYSNAVNYNLNNKCWYKVRRAVTFSKLTLPSSSFCLSSLTPTNLWDLPKNGWQGMVNKSKLSFFEKINRLINLSWSKIFKNTKFGERIAKNISIKC